MRCQVTETNELADFLRDADLTYSGLNEPGVRVWVQRNDTGAITASTGYELSADGRHALIRSVAVHPRAALAGTGSRTGFMGARTRARGGRDYGMVVQPAVGTVLAEPRLRTS